MKTKHQDRLVVVAMNGQDAAAVLRVLRTAKLPKGCRAVLPVLAGLLRAYLVVGGVKK